jgi:hypothetical protein
MGGAAGGEGAGTPTKEHAVKTAWFEVHSVVFSSRMCLPSKLASHRCSKLPVHSAAIKGEPATALATARHFAFAG